MPIPTVSVVVPAYNAAGTIAEALASVWAQTFTNYEVIVVDDASTDGTAAIAQAELSRDRTIGSADRRVISLPRNSGPAAARNAGIRAVQGEWVAFLDGDDTWLPWKLDLQIKLVEAYGTDVAFCGASVAMGEPAAPPRAGIRSGAIKALGLRDFAVRNEVATSTVLVKKETLGKAGLFDERFRGPEDYDLWIRLAAEHRILKLGYPLFRYRDVRGSLSRDDRTFLPEVLRVLDKAYAEGGALYGIPAKRRAQAYQCLCAAWMAAERGAPGRALTLFSRSLCRWPFPFEPYLRLPWCRVKLLAGLARHYVSMEPKRSREP